MQNAELTLVTFSRTDQNPPDATGEFATSSLHELAKGAVWEPRTPSRLGPLSYGPNVRSVRRVDFSPARAIGESKPEVEVSRALCSECPRNCPSLSKKSRR